MEPLPDGQFSVTVSHLPARQRASDSVTIRAEAWDVDDNRVTQTVTDAYQLTNRVPVDCRGAACGSYPS